MKSLTLTLLALVLFCFSVDAKPQKISFPGVASLGSAFELLLVELAPDKFVLSEMKAALKKEKKDTDVDESKLPWLGTLVLGDKIMILRAVTLEADPDEKGVAAVKKLTAEVIDLKMGDIKKSKKAGETPVDQIKNAKQLGSLTLATEERILKNEKEKETPFLVLKGDLKLGDKVYDITHAVKKTAKKEKKSPPKKEEPPAAGASDEAEESGNDEE